MQFIKDYMLDSTLRSELNALARKTFGLSFEKWVSEGYYEGDYIPYSYEENGELVSNASANIMVFDQLGEEKKYIQIGTVMTAEGQRHKGYARELMQKVMAEYEGKVDGIYLFGEPSVAEFYEKLGFKRGLQYRYILKDEVLMQLKAQRKALNEEELLQEVDAKDEVHKKHYFEMVRSCGVQSALEQKNKYGLQGFYTMSMEDIYYIKSLDAYVCLEQEGDKIFLQSIICREQVSLEDILIRLPMDYKQLIMGFTPCREAQDLFEMEPFDGGDDYIFFYYGEALESIEAEQLYFPAFSHA